MKTYYIKDLQINQVFANETFAIFEKKKSQDKNGNDYYDILLGDKTGRIQSKIWGDSIPNVDTKAIKEGSVVKISGKVDEFRKNLQINISSLESVDEVALEDYLESSQFDPDEMYKELEDEIKKVEDEEIRVVLKDIVSNKEIARKLKYWPAAISIHHNFRSGFLQHILEMFAIADGLERFYPEVDFSILKAGIILHDIGKLEEIDGSNISLPYTKKGYLLGHIYMGAELFQKFGEGKIAEDKYLHILHLILSHHGKYEFGSPVNPATPEALMLSYIDEVSAKPRSAISIQNAMKDEEEFSNRIWYLENVKIWNSRKKGKGIEVDPKKVSSKKEDSLTDQISLV